MRDYALIDNTSGAFPNVVSTNASGPGETDGTPYIKDFVDDLWGARQALMTAASMTPNGVTEASGASQTLDAMKEVIRLMLAAERLDSGGLDVTTATANTIALIATGNGTGAGIEGIGGATGHGVLGLGGATSGAGGVFVARGGDYPGIGGDGYGTGPGGDFQGGANGVGVKGEGGGTSGEGGYFTAMGGDTSGIYGAGHGSGAGGYFAGGATGNGVTAHAGASGGKGGAFYATNNDLGIVALGNGTGQGGSFAGGVNAAAVNLTPRAGTPSTVYNGDIWFDSTAGKLCVRIADTNYSCDLTAL